VTFLPGAVPVEHVGGDALVVSGLLSADALAQLKFNLGQHWWPQPGSGAQGPIIYVTERIENTTSCENVEADASTEATEAHAEADRRIVEHFRVRLERVFWNGRDEVFEDGMESEFSRALVDSVERGGISAVEAIREIVASGHANEEVVGEALRWMGLMDQPSTRTARRRALENALVSPAARVRDGAALGLAFMDDPAAIPSLKRAIEKEESDGLRHDLKQVLAQLEDTRKCPSC
jgi:HEAT repeat protein